MVKLESVKDGSRLSECYHNISFTLLLYNILFEVHKFYSAAESSVSFFLCCLFSQSINFYVYPTPIVLANDHVMLSDDSCIGLKRLLLLLGILQKQKDDHCPYYLLSAVPPNKKTQGNQLILLLGDFFLGFYETVD